MGMRTTRDTKSLVLVSLPFLCLFRGSSGNIRDSPQIFSCNSDGIIFVRLLSDVLALLVLLLLLPSALVILYVSGEWVSLGKV